MVKSLVHQLTLQESSLAYATTKRRLRLRSENTAWLTLRQHSSVYASTGGLTS